MADETEDPDIAAARLEVALEQIARRAAAPRVAPTVTHVPVPDPMVGVVADRLDSLIDRLRDALATR